MKRLLAMVLMVSACTTTSTATSSQGVIATPTITEGPTTAPTPTGQSAATEQPTPEPTPDPTRPSTYGVNDVVTITQNGQPWAEVTITKVSMKAQYNGAYGFNDVPKKGNVYLQAFVTYKALTDGVDYNPYDWQVFVNDQAVENTTFVSNGPNPTLSSGTLPSGRKASGWVVYEVAKTGRVLMSYGGTFGNQAPVFEVVVRTR